MHKWVAVAGGLCAWLLLAGSSPAQEAECRAVIAKAMKAVGGEDKLAKIKATQVKGKGVLSVLGKDLDFTVETLTQPPDKFRIVVDLVYENNNIKLLQVFNGPKGWLHYMDKTMDLDADTIKAVKDATYTEKVTNLVDLKKKEYKLSPLGEVKVGDHQTVGILVSHKGYPDLSLYFDKKSHLLVKSEGRAYDQVSKQEVNQEKLYSEYKELIPGLKVASRILINNEGKKYMDLTITEVQPVERHDDSMFTKP